MPFVALAGVNDDALGTRLVQAGAEDYLVKGQPDRVLLVRTIRHAIERHRLLVEVLTNLVGNAIKFTPEGGCMTIGAEQRGESVVVSVVDTGPGIAPEDWEKVFERFAQVGRQPGAGAKGTGLGLTICRDIVSLHGGKIWVEGAPGEGSRFLFTLPIAGPKDALVKSVAAAVESAKESESPAMS